MQTLSSVTSITLSSATGTLTGSGSTNVADGDTVTIGAQVYRFKSAIAQLYDVHIAGSGNSDTSLLNLIRAINGSGTPGTDWYTGTPVNSSVTAAASVTSHAFAVTAISAGLYGNNIATTETSSVLSWGGATLTGGQTVTIVGTASFQTFTQPRQQNTVGEFPANKNWSRAHRVSDAAYFIIRNGANSVAMLVNQFMAVIGVALEPSLSWPPIVSTQPNAATCAGTAAASGTLTGSGSTNVSDGDTVTIGSTVYRFKTVMAQINDIQISGSGNSDTSLTNLIDAINGTGAAGTNWFAGTVANTKVSAGALAAHAFLATALASGLAGNAIATTKSSSVVSWGGTTLSGGTDAAATFTVVTGVTESTVTYQWQYSTDGGTTWVNSTGTISGTVYTNDTTATLTCTPSTTGQTGKLHRCVLTNASGATDSNGVALTIS